MKNKDSKRYSYQNIDVRERNFIHKNFNKTKSYKANFSYSIFENVSFLASSFKWCSFYGVKFHNCYMKGMIFRGSNLREAHFKDCVLSGVIFDRAKLKGVKFENCKIYQVKDDLRQYLKSECFENVEFFDQYPKESRFSKRLLERVRSLRGNEYIRRSRVLHRKRGRLDTLSLSFLVDAFGESFLEENLLEIDSMIKTDFSSLSYLVRVLHRIRDRDKK